MGLFSRQGYSRLPVPALDHDFTPADKVTPIGVLVPQLSETFFFFITAPLTADALVDAIRATWLLLAPRFPAVKTLWLNLDNGPENHSRRTQFMHRLTHLADEAQLNLELAYYPPYHSKYNPVERVWGVLEQHWNGSLLDSRHTIMELAKTMTYKRIHPVVKELSKTYTTGVKLTQKAMAKLEQRFERWPDLEKYFVRIPCVPPST